MDIEPFLGEIGLAPFGFAPRGWAPCEGQLLQINQNQALFSLLGTTYGGNGQTTFALPDLRGRIAVHMGNYLLGQVGGAVYVTVAPGEMPPPRLAASSEEGTIPNPGGAFPALGGAYAQTQDAARMRPDAVSSVPGGGLKHYNVPPYLGLYYVIALQGIFPSRN